MDVQSEPVSESYWREGDSGLEEGFAGLIAPPVSNLSRGVVGKEVPAFPGAVQDTGCACWPPGLKVKAPDRHACQRVRRLKAVASAVHSAATFIRPRSRNLGTPICSLIIPNTGSTSCFLCLYASLAAAVDIQARVLAQCRVVGAYGHGAAHASLRDAYPESRALPAFSS